MNFNHLIAWIQRDPINAINRAEAHAKDVGRPRKENILYAARVGAILLTISLRNLYTQFNNAQGKPFATFEEYLTHFCNSSDLCRSRATDFKTISPLYYALRSRGYFAESIDLLVVLNRVSQNIPHAVSIYQKELVLSPAGKVTAAQLRRKYVKAKRMSRKLTAKSAALSVTPAAQSLTGTVTLPASPTTQSATSSDHNQRDKDLALRLKVAVGSQDWNAVVECIRVLDPDLETCPTTVPAEDASTPSRPEAMKSDSLGTASATENPQSDAVLKTTAESSEFGADTHITQGEPLMTVTVPADPETPSPGNSTTPACQLEKAPCESASLSDWQVDLVVDLGDGGAARFFNATSPSGPKLRVEIYYPGPISPLKTKLTQLGFYTDEEDAFGESVMHRVLMSPRSCTEAAKECICAWIDERREKELSL